MGSGTSSGRTRNKNQGKPKLPPLAGNVQGAKRIFYDAMNSDEARGANRLLFTSGMKEDRVGIRSNWANAYAEGSYEIIKYSQAGDALERVNGIITTAAGGRLIGVQGNDEEGYTVTDIRTGMMITRMATLGGATYQADSIYGGLTQRQENQLATAEKRFKSAHQKTD